MIIHGDTNKIDLGSSSFKHIREKGYLYIDKSNFIEHFLLEPNSVQVILRQRRLGKSLNMDMLKCFLDESEDNTKLFEGLNISESTAWNKLNSSPVLMFDFKNLTEQNYKNAIFIQILRYIEKYIDLDKLDWVNKIRLENYIADKGETITDGLLFLTELVYKKTNNKPYIFIDEYDKLLTDNYNSDKYDEIKSFETAVMSAALKGNEYLEKALLTGIMRVSRESILSGLNNIYIYDLFSDETYKYDFGLNNDEIDELSKVLNFDKTEIKQWYNGIKINGNEIYNIYSMLSYIKTRELNNYWGRSGTIDIIHNMITESREKQLMQMLNNKSINVSIDDRISLKSLNNNPNDSAFYSLVVQSGYLSVERYIGHSNQYEVRIPNKELMNVWKQFILSRFSYPDSLKTIFDNINDLVLFDKDLENLLSDKLSYFDITSDSTDKRAKEKIYHVFTLGLLSAYDEIACRVISNRESGDGRYDILFETSKYTIIFEFKISSSIDKLEVSVNDALDQIIIKRYHIDANKDKPIIITGIAFYNKKCIVKSNRIQ